MLFVRPKVTDLTFHLFGRSVHPELFDACASRVVERSNYRIQINITSVGHLISFLREGLIVTEVCASPHQPLPQQHRLFSQRLESSHEHHRLHEDQIRYKSEFAGGVFSPSGKTYFVNIQHAGLTVAIQGPWQTAVGGEAALGS